MKYLIVKASKRQDAPEMAVLFSSMLRHSETAKTLPEGFEIVSAGFYSVLDSKVLAERSTSVGPAPRGERDARIIAADLARRDE